MNARGDLHYSFLAALVTVAALLLLVQGASAQAGSCSATTPCPDTTNCCSQYGYCGTGSAYCGTGCKNGPCTAATGSCSATRPCPDTTNCCSQYGYCGTGSAYCGTGCKNGPCTAATGSCSATRPCPDTTNCCSQYGYCGTGSTYCGTGCQNGPCTTGWSSFLTKAVFEKFFPNHLAFYTYENFRTAAQAPYTAFGTTGTLDDQKRELAAFLANVNQETGGLQYIEEVNKSFAYCDATNTQFPCASGKKYYGRGALQISWNYNYGACGQALNLPLLANPDLVAQDGALAFRTALWAWMTSNCHNAIMKNSFSGTINAINGGLECNQPAGSVGHNEMLDRVSYYKSFCSQLGVNPGTDLTC